MDVVRSTLIAAVSVLAVPVVIAAVVLAIVLTVVLGIVALVVCSVVLAPLTAVRRKVSARRQYRAVR